MSLPRTTRLTSPGRRLRNEPAGFLDPRLDARHLTVKLLLVNELEDFADPRSGRESEGKQMAAEQQWCGRLMFDAERTRSFEEPVHRTAVEVSRAAQTVGARHAREEFQIDFLGEAAECAVADISSLPKGSRLEMVRDETDDLPSNVEAVDAVDVQPVEQRHGRLNAGLLVIERSDAPFHDSGGRRLAEIVAHGAEHQGSQAGAIEIAVQFERFVNHHERVCPDVTFGMPRRFLNAPDGWKHFRHHLSDDPEIECELESDRRASGLQEKLFDFSPDTLGGKIVQRQRAAERRCLRLEGELETCGELHGAERTQAVVGKCVQIHGAQQTSFKISATIERVFVAAGQRIPRDRVDREVASPRGFGDVHRWIAMNLEPLVTPAPL